MTVQRVYLRGPRKEDAEELVAAMTADRSFHRPWSSPPDTREAYANWLGRNSGEGSAAYLICRREDRAIAGTAVLGHIIYGALRSAYLGYDGVPAFGGRGYMTEGLLLVLRRGFRSLRLHRIEANVQPGNDRSRRLLERCGFTREGYSRRYLRIGGRWRDHERWALLSEDFRSPWP